MIPAAHRLRLGEDFTRVFRSGIRVRSDHLMAHSLKTVDDSHAARVGFIVSKAVGNAVHRNLVKRRLREIVRPLVTDFSPGSLLVIRAQPNAAEAEFSQLQSEVTLLLEKAEKKKLQGRGRRT